MTPSPTVMANLRQELRRHAPFAQMSTAGVDAFIAASEEVHFAPDENLLAPADGAVECLFYVRRGAVTGRHGDGQAFAYDAGDLFPIGAVVGQRAVTATYTANGDLFCLQARADAVRALAQRESVFADFLAHRVRHYLELSRRASQIDASSTVLATQSMESPLGALPRKAILACTPDSPLGDALLKMHERRLGSVLVVDASGRLEGILTRHDVLERVALAQVPLTAPIRDVMTKPVLALSPRNTAEDAALLMSRHGIRHVPVIENGNAVNVVSERDLFALQRLSLTQLSGSLHRAPDVETLRRLAPEIREFARGLVAQGVAVPSLTALVSHLNDALTRRLVELLARRHTLDLGAACWLAFGSEGRGEQTIATDQDNGIVFRSDDGDRERLRGRWLALGADVNAELDACGYPLCRGGIMAGQPACCRSDSEWRERFDHWIEHGAPEDLLAANIYFDLRGIAGDETLARELREHITEHARVVPRFIRQLAENALRSRPPLAWHGAIDADERGGVDLKMQGTALFVDVARAFALANGIGTTGTRERLTAIGRALNAPIAESESWTGAFDFLQMLRLRVQRNADAAPNHVELTTLSDIDRRVLRESLRVARRLQQRLELDYMR